MSTLLFVYNPHSGVQTIGRKLSEIVNLYTSIGFDVIVHPTQQSEDCKKTVMRLANEVDRVIVAGGDGTHNEAVNGLIECGCPMPYGYIPCGSTNDFSHSLGIPVQIMKAAKNAVYGDPFAYDVGMMNGRYFTYVAGFGAFTEVTYSTPQQQKNTLGYIAYLISGVASVPNIVPYHVKFETPIRSGEGDYVLGLVTNTLQVGGMKNILPRDIALDDGLFEVLLVKNPRNPIDLNKILVSAVKHDFEADCFEYFKTPYIKITSEKPLAWTLDGENGGAYNVTEISCHPKAVRVATEQKTNLKQLP